MVRIKDIPPYHEVCGSAVASSCPGMGGPATERGPKHDENRGDLSRCIHTRTQRIRRRCHFELVFWDACDGGEHSGEGTSGYVTRHGNSRFTPRACRIKTQRLLDFSYGQVDGEITCNERVRQGFLIFFKVATDVATETPAAGIMIVPFFRAR